MKSKFNIDQLNTLIKTLKDVPFFTNELKDQLSNVFIKESFDFEVDAFRRYTSKLEKAEELFSSFIKGRKTSLKDKILNITNLDHSEEEKADALMYSIIAAAQPASVINPGATLFSNSLNNIATDANNALDLVVKTSGVGFFLRMLLKLEKSEGEATTWEEFNKKLKEYATYMNSSPYANNDYTKMFPKNYKKYEQTKAKILEMSEKKYNQNKEAIIKDIEELNDLGLTSNIVKEEISKFFEKASSLVANGNSKLKEVRDALYPFEVEAHFSKKMRIEWEDSEFYSIAKEAGLLGGIQGQG